MIVGSMVKGKVLLGYASAFIFLIFLASCKEGLLFSDSQSITDGSWKYGNELVFDFEITDTLPVYDLTLDITYDEETFNFENLYCTVKTSFPDGAIIEDLVSFEMQTISALENTKCKGSHCQIPIILQEGIAFNQLGTYRIGFEQNGRQENLQGIEKLTLTVIKKK